VRGGRGVRPAGVIRASCQPRRCRGNPCAIHSKIQQFTASVSKTAGTRGAIVVVEEREADVPTTAAIIGAGIAGPALAIALRHAGIHATVYEASDAPRDETGAFLNLAPNGINVLHALGAEGVLDGLGFQNDRLVFHNESGRLLADVSVGGVTMMRGALSRRLREAAERSGVRVEFGKSLASIEARDGDVVARFLDGTSTCTTCLIGADGIHSRTRTSQFADAFSPVYTGILNLGGIVHTDLPSTGQAMHMVFGRRGFFGYAVRPDGETYWFSNFAQKVAPSPVALAEVDAGHYRRALLEVHHDDPPEVRRIIEAIAGTVGAYPVYEIPSLPVWHRGRIGLIGDAAHAIGPHVGQGASLALEDALVVAKCLRDAPDPAAAFATFEQLRRPRVEPIVKQSRRTGRQKAPSGWLGRKVRDLVLPVFLRQGAEAAGELSRYRFDWNETGHSM
jgi:2-polyprenyl-6-methoxyphenol hydroxylase-like FAD-dependent oxidoreductase